MQQVLSFYRYGFHQQTTSAASTNTGNLSGVNCRESETSFFFYFSTFMSGPFPCRTFIPIQPVITFYFFTRGACHAKFAELSVKRVLLLTVNISTASHPVLLLPHSRFMSDARETISATRAVSAIREKVARLLKVDLLERSCPVFAQQTNNVTTSDFTRHCGSVLVALCC